MNTETRRSNSNVLNGGRNMKLLSARAGFMLIAATAFSYACLSPIGAGGQQERGTTVTLDGLKSRTPGDWVEETPTSRFRVKQFRLAAVGDDKENAQLIIFYFGSGAGGSVADNIARWKKMFIPPEGKTIGDVAKVEKLKIDNVDYTYFDVHGTYLAKSRPNLPDSEATPYPNYRMLAGVFETKDGPYFIRLVGPADTVKHYKAGFDQWLKAFK
jgi:hypothetical protein